MSTCPACRAYGRKQLCADSVAGWVRPLRKAQSRNRRAPELCCLDTGGRIERAHRQRRRLPVIQHGLQLSLAVRRYMNAGRCAMPSPARASTRCALLSLAATVGCPAISIRSPSRARRAARYVRRGRRSTSRSRALAPGRTDASACRDASDRQAAAHAPPKAPGAGDSPTSSATPVADLAGIPADEIDVRWHRRHNHTSIRGAARVKGLYCPHAVCAVCSRARHECRTRPHGIWRWMCGQRLRIASVTPPGQCSRGFFYSSGRAYWAPPFCSASSRSSPLQHR